MVTVEDFSRLVSGIYAAAVTPECWSPAIRDIEHVLGAAGSALLIADTGNRALLSATLPPECGMSYGQHYYRLDNHLAAVEQGPVGAVHSATQLASRIKRNTEFYVDWMRPFELDDALFVRLTGGVRPTCFVTTSTRTSLDTPEQIRVMSGLVAHLQQALRTQDKLAALAHSTVEMADALEAVRHGIVVVASENLVVNLNSAAERIFRAGDGLCTRSGRIAASSTHADRELHLAIRDALTCERSPVRTGRSLTCVRPSGRRPYVIHVLPSHRRDADEPLSRPTVLVLIIDPEDEPEPDAALMRRLYHLTRAEADVALRIMHGADPKEISDQLSVSLPTVRTHLQHVFDKTNTHRQADLVRLLVRLLLVLSP
jgi:DNA-binding CsgD family transcriptional regulator